VIAVGIITAPRVKPTIYNSVLSYRRAGFTQPTYVFAEPGSEVVGLDGIHYMNNVTKLGNFRNWVRALGTLLQMSGQDWLMICEDDISWAWGASNTLEYDLSKYNRDAKTGAISLYCPIRMSKVLERDYANGRPLMHGWYGAKLGRSTWGAQCLVFHRDWALQLLNDQVLLAFLADPRWDKNVDALVAEAINRKGREVVYRIPCLVDHTFGDGNSSLGYKADRPELKTKYFKDL
jgi:hypothetical protein